ncbi:MAG TPA: hypothetical protein VGQ76_08530 [Thermoanaerobaculia bacterium]|jgi:hypothetical protein|nr:hypothetical protein [Thermoanaerobaculia bacterium]
MEHPRYTRLCRRTARAALRSNSEMEHPEMGDAPEGTSALCDSESVLKVPIERETVEKSRRHGRDHAELEMIAPGFSAAVTNWLKEIAE